MSIKSPPLLKYILTISCGGLLFMVLIKTDEIPPVFDLFFYLWLVKFHQAKHKVHV